MKSYQAACQHHKDLTIARNIPIKIIPAFLEPTTPVASEKKKFYNVFILGQSGTGKSTFVNAMTNYLQYESLNKALAAGKPTCIIPCKFEVQDDDYKSTIVNVGDATNSSENFNDLGHSVTQKPQEYKFNANKNEIVHLFDTPGLADSRGINQDDINLDLIRKAVFEVDCLHALCFVLKANESKLSASLETTMQSLLSFFPPNAFELIIFCFTHSRGSGYTIGDTIKPIRTFIDNFNQSNNVMLPFGKENIFCMDNEGFRFLCAKFRNIAYTTTSSQEYELSWQKSRDASFKFINHLKTMKPFYIKIFYDDFIGMFKIWANNIRNDRNISSERINRFGKTALFLQQVFLGNDAEKYLEFAVSKGYKIPARSSLSCLFIMNLMRQECADRDTQYDIREAIKTFLVSYTINNFLATDL
uniref:AIG1-type G domain-containing protein n=1 Tax=Panagrolaimus sp. ES5 TaxID=591445 RepID=A0AC34FSA5_9BILA